METVEKIRIQKSEVEIWKDAIKEASKSMMIIIDSIRVVEEDGEFLVWIYPTRADVLIQIGIKLKGLMN